MGEGEERHLPGPPAVRVGIEVELVHHGLAHVGLLTAAEGDVGQDLCRAANDRGRGVYRRVAGHHPYGLASEHVAQVEKLLAHECFDRCCVKGALAGGQGGEVGPGGHEALARTGGRGHDHVGSRHHVDQSFLLRGVQGKAPIGHPVGEGIEEGIGGWVDRDAVG